MKKLFLGLIGIMMSIFLIGCGGEKEVETTENTKKIDSILSTSIRIYRSIGKRV